MTLRKCPACSDVVGAESPRCPRCGVRFRSAQIRKLLFRLVGAAVVLFVLIDLAHTMH